MRRPANRMGNLMMLGALTLLLSAAAGLAAPAASVLGVIAATTPLAVVVHLLHAFPSGRCRGTVSRSVVVVGYAVCIVLQAPQYLMDPSGSPAGVLALADRPDVAHLAHGLQVVTGAGVMVATAVLLALRWRRASPARARILAPLYIYGGFAVLAIPVGTDLVAPAAGLDGDQVLLVQGIILAVVPLAFLAALRSGGFTRVGELRELSVRLAADDRGLLGPVLADALGDPSARLVFRRAVGSDDFVDADGRPVVIPERDPTRAAVMVAAGGVTVGAIVYDPAAVDDGSTVQAAARVIALAMDRQRLEVELRAEQRVVRESRARLVAAADGERERIARDLHDGLQVQLVLLSVQAQRLVGRADMPAEAAADAERLRRRIDQAAARVRGLVFTVMPPLLVERGLVAAVEDLADRMPVPTTVAARVDPPVPEPVRSTAYFVVAELLSNAAKHAAAGRVEIDLARRDDRLMVIVGDDGVGGVDVSGRGMRGVADRVAALGGTVAVDSVVGAGTTVTMMVPCGF